MAAERAFVERALIGDNKVVDELARRMACVPRMLANLNAKSGRLLNEHDLEDVTQEAFEVVLRRLRDYDPYAPLESWFYGICTRLLLDAVRKKVRARQREGELDQEPAAAALPPSLTVPAGAEIANLLATLGGFEAQVLRLKHLEGLTFTEIARRLRMSPNTAKTLHYRGCTKLREMLDRAQRREEGP